MEVKHWYYDTCWWKHRGWAFCLSIRPSVCMSSSREKFLVKVLMYVWNTFRGHIELQQDLEVKHWYYDTCWWKQNYFNEFFAVWTLPFFQHISGKSFRLKFLMYVWNTFRGHIKLQKRLQMDSMEVKHWYYNTCWWKLNYFNDFVAVWTLPFVQHIPGKSFRWKFLMYVWNTFRGHIEIQKDFRWTVWRSNIDILIHADEN